MSEAPLDPIRAAQAHMRQAAVRRFYRTVEVREVEGGRHALTLDGRGARTPGRNALSATSRALMLKVAAEWERQRETIDPADMPLTRLLNSAIDGVARTMAETRAEILRYAGSDLLCYRAEAPEALAERQAEAFDPTLRWAAETLGAPLTVAVGVVHVEQPPRVDRGSAPRAGGVRRPGRARGLERNDEPYRLRSAGARDGARLSRRRRRRGAAAHVDEDFQNEHWGVDEEARVRRAARWREMEAAAIAGDDRSRA